MGGYGGTSTCGYGMGEYGGQCPATGIPPKPHAEFIEYLPLQIIIYAHVEEQLNYLIQVLGKIHEKLKTRALAYTHFKKVFPSHIHSLGGLHQVRNLHVNVSSKLKEFKPLTYTTVVYERFKENIGYRITEGVYLLWRFLIK